MFATDADFGIAAQGSYEIVGRNSGNALPIDDASSSQVFTAPRSLEVQATYSLTVSATDGGSFPVSTFTTVNACITDVGSAFNAKFYNATLGESATTGTVVLTVTTVDEWGKWHLVHQLRRWVKAPTPDNALTRVGSISAT